MHKASINDVVTPSSNRKPRVGSSSPHDEIEQIKRTVKILKRIIYTFLALILIAIVGLVLAHEYSIHRTASKTKQTNTLTDPVPTSVRRSVSFNIYYPVQSRLPAGYILNTSSFTSNKLAVVYEVSAPNQQKLVFSLQQKPSTTDLQVFNSKYLPLHLTVTTGVGVAAIGVLNQKTLVSLPTNSNAWILITAPINTNQDQLSQVLNALRITQ